MASERPSLREQASGDTLASLLELDPAPMETPSPSREKDLPPLPTDPSTEGKDIRGVSRSTTSSVGLSGSNAGHSAIFYLSRIQRFSSYLIPVFTSIHITNTAIIPLMTRSVAASETYLLQSRELYQTTLSEPILVALPIAAHIASGLALRLIRRSQNLNRYGGATKSMYALQQERDRAHSNGSRSSSRDRAGGRDPSLRIWPPLSWISASGYAFSFFTAAHVAINRFLPLWVEGDSSSIGLGYVSHGFARHGVMAWLAYTGLLVAGCGHMVWGAAKWAGIAPTAMGWRGSGMRVEDKKVRRHRRRTWWGIQGVAVALTALWAAGGLVVAKGGRMDGWIGKVYDGIYDTLPF